MANANVPLKPNPKRGRSIPDEYGFFIRITPLETNFETLVLSFTLSAPSSIQQSQAVVQQPQWLNDVRDSSTGVACACFDRVTIWAGPGEGLARRAPRSAFCYCRIYAAGALRLGRSRRVHCAFTRSDHAGGRYTPVARPDPSDARRR